MVDPHGAALEKLRAALDELGEKSPQATDGKWLERLTAECAPIIVEWDINRAWLWKEWPGRTHPDAGIDVVAERSDGALIAIQCKSRKIKEGETTAPINKAELNSFIAESTSKVSAFASRWLVVNGPVAISNTHAQRVMEDHDVALVNLHADLRKQVDAAQDTEPESCPHCADPTEPQTRNCMQDETVRTAVASLREHAQGAVGAARGRVILPCGTGKSRIALRLIEELCGAGEVAAVLCPSIALVSQLRREFLLHATGKLTALAVCSDQTAGRGSDLSKDPTADLSKTRAKDVRGRVTTDSGEISAWMDQLPADRIGVIFGTYQSSHRIADALVGGKRLAVLVADEAHRTAGIRRVKGQEEQLRDFTVCHNQEKFPATYRIYQTATPKVYGTPNAQGKERKLQSGDWIVRSMDDEATFGPELYRRSYRDAVENGWLSDYRIIALGVNDEDAYKEANKLASAQGASLSTTQLLRGLPIALVLGGATRGSGHVVRSAINFLNTVKHSEEMTNALQSEAVRQWVAGRLMANGDKSPPAQYRLEHLDAGSNVAQREEATAKLAEASDETPHGILNVGIFGEGTDAPSLSAVGFIEPRKSPVEVIQAVGRVMRRSEGKSLGYILCPIVIPPNVDAESWLANSATPDDGWQALGQILMALRAHDDRIEEKLADLMTVYLPPAPSEDVEVSTVVGLGSESGRASYHIHQGKPGAAERAAEGVVKGNVRPGDVFQPFVQPEAGPRAAHQPNAKDDPQRIVTAKPTADGTVEMRERSVVRDKPKSDGTPGPVNMERTKKAAKATLNGKDGRVIKPRRTKEETAADQAKIREQRTLNLLEKSKADEMGIFVNLLEKSGLCRNRALRSVNTLEGAIAEARRCLEGDELTPMLNAHFGINQAEEPQSKGKPSADGCTVASLLLMNAAMLHQRIAGGGWLPGVDGLEKVKNATNAAQLVLRQWNTITRHDFRPVLEPAIEVIWAVQDTGKVSGLNRALRHLAGEAERLAFDYADLGADYAGELFNKVMGHQASDGAFFTRPVAASLLARLALDVAAPDADWTDSTPLGSGRIVDLACGSGTLLAASLADMKRRAREQGAVERQLGELQKVAVENTLVGLDFNPVSLQLAAAQLTAGNADVTYRNMGLHRMPYGESGGQVRAGSLELLAQRPVIGIGTDELDYGDHDDGSEPLRLTQDDPTLEDAVKAVTGARVVIMNPPFTERGKMGEKFPVEIRSRLRKRVDGLESTLVQSDSELDGFISKTSIGPLFEALAEKCADAANGIVAMVCHQPSEKNLSQNTSINESLIVARRLVPREGAKPSTRIISLDRLPTDDQAVAELHERLAQCETGLLSDGWGEVSEWPVDRIESGDWTAGAFRAPEVANAAFDFANDRSLLQMEEQGMVPSAVLSGGGQMKDFKQAPSNAPGAFPILYFKGEEAQLTIRGVPDRHWAPQKSLPRREWIEVPGTDGPQHPVTAGRIMKHASYLLVSAGQDTGSARLTAVAQEERCVGVGWLPVPGVTLARAKAAAVFLNSTVGRLQLLRNPGKKLAFPLYRPAGLKTIRLPDLSDNKVVDRLSHCWEATAGMEVPQYRDGECDVRRIWDDAVADALGWEKEWLAGLRRLLHREPHVRGLGYGEVG